MKVRLGAIAMTLVFVGFGCSMHRGYEAKCIDEVRQDAHLLPSLLVSDADDGQRLPRLLDYPTT